MKYLEKLKDPRWQKKRLEVMQRDEWKCRDCFSKDKQLHVHHCFYENEPWEIENKYLITLCSDCHVVRQSIEQDGKVIIGQISSILNQTELYDFIIRLDWIFRDFEKERKNA